MINHNGDQRSHTYEISRPGSRHRHKYSKCKKCLSMMALVYIKGVL